jgi:pimeloyl-ACP methyl ester carboxylesterase
MRRLAPILAALLALAGCASKPPERFPTSRDYPAGVMRWTSFQAGGHPWRLAALETPRSAPWKVVVITGTPSWADFWAPTLAAMPEGYSMVAVDRPGFSASEPAQAVGSISDQADAMAPLLDAEPGQRIMLVGQSYGAPIAALMAARHPDRVQALVLVSPFFGDRGKQARRLTGLGGLVKPMLGRDLKNSLTEVRGQPAQLPAARTALAGLTMPLVVVQGLSDDFAPPATARALAEKGHPLGPTRFVGVPGGDHFLNACCVAALVGAFQTAAGMADAVRP